MADDWPRVTIESLIASGAITGHKDGNHGSQYPRVEEFGSSGVPFLTAKSLSEGTVDIAGAPRLSDERADKLRLGFVEPDDVLLSHNATIGRVGVVPNVGGRLLIGTSLTYFRLDQSRVYPRYLAAYFAGVDFQNQLAAVMSHTTRNQVPITAQRRLCVVIPPLIQQQAIASILGALDDKIELNRRRNRTLEAMARAIFQSWFVDFDPVKAKAAGQHPPGLTPSLAALFPDTFEDSDLGPIPKGWRVVSLDDVAGFVLGGDWGKESPSTATPSPAFCIRGADIPSIQTGGLGNMPIRYLKESSLNKRSLRDGDLVIEISGGSPTQSTGRPVLITTGLLASLEHSLTCSNFCRIFRPSISNYSKYLYLLLRWHYDIDTFLQYENGTTGIKNFAFTKFAETYPLLLPSDEVVKQFDQLVSPLFEERQELGRESRTLAALRDTLLPKLISGELRVPDAERIVGRAV